MTLGAFTYAFNGDSPGNPTDYWRGLTTAQAHEMVRQHVPTFDVNNVLLFLDAGGEYTLNHGVRLKRLVP